LTISLIVPTRQRLEKLERMIRSVIKNAADPACIEIILVIDQDDHSYDDFVIENVRLTRVITPPGLTMGQLNMAGYSACTGDYIMLMNDDVVASTPNWDQTVLGVFRDHPDGVLLVHVNDKIFGSVLCTFPFVTRKFCDLAGGICLSDYRRYRIDDHIYSVFGLLSVLGHNRIVYLENVVFEHLNTVTDEHGVVSYQPDPEIHAFDTELFDESLESRKTLALDLAEVIRAHKFRNDRQRRAQILAPITDTVALRRPEFIRFDYENLIARQAARVTVCVVTADLRSVHAKRCLELLKLYTTNYDLVILDNNRGPNFNHSREMNKLIETCRTNYLVLLDDDIFVEPGWLGGMLAACGPGVGVVTPLHKSTDGNLSYAGIVMNPDYSGAHTHALAVHPTTFPIQTLCSAIMLIDIVKCGDLRVDESYSKYFLDLDFGLRVWEHGYQVVCTPHVGVTHVGGGTLAYGTELASALYEEQRLHFVREWIATGRYAALERSEVWRSLSEIRTILDFPNRIMDLTQGLSERDAAAAIRDVESLLDAIHPYPALEYWMTDQVYRRLKTQSPDFAADETRTLAILAGQFDYAIPVREMVDGAEKIYLWFGRYYEVPGGHFNRDMARTGLYKSAARIDYLASAAAPSGIDPAGTPEDHEIGLKGAEPQLCEAGYRGFNIIRCGSVFAISQAEGAFQFDRAQRGDYPVMFRGETVADVRAQIDQLEPTLLEEGYRGFNLVQFDRCYALLQADGAFDIALTDQYKPLFEAPDLAGLRLVIDAFHAGLTAASEQAIQEPEFPASEHLAEPVLCEEGFRRFNLLRCGDVFIGFPQYEGAFDPARAEALGYPVMVAGANLADIKGQIDRLEPTLLEEGYKGFNVVRFDRVYGLPQADGPFQIERALAGAYLELHEGADLAAVKRSIDAQGPARRLKTRLKRRFRLQA
jgi:GT2 family glycosyltransferase